ncbi:methyltransferase domain-containing protein [Actinokineospora guangxiensis]|uniref:Methyltransferase domain-containing protein n=1 Tax=Actinokineospora guangxiensis TaxID=1490288 RepID=A0ABW0EY69_9PSEU
MTFTPDWLALREPADAAARSTALLPPLIDVVADRPEVVVHDLGCGTGSMARWLAPRLPAPQRWVLHDHDPALLAVAASAVDGAETRVGDLAAADLHGADLVTASALLDLLTEDEVDAVAAACAGRPALLALSVAGRVEFAEPDPMDEAFQEAFNDHQRRGGLLGPGAVAAAERAFGAHGARVLTAASPWRLGGGALAEEWLAGWVGAARQQRPELPADYLDRRRGSLDVLVHHTDLLALPGSRR